MALKTNTSASAFKSELKGEPSGHRKVQSLNKPNYAPKKVASGNISDSPLVGLKTEASSNGLKG
tara:strand:+ start:458 stop:649 length:192 start_codon:yes stop_codon:yes gene_type:complete